MFAMASNRPLDLSRPNTQHSDEVAPLDLRIRATPHTSQAQQRQQDGAIDLSMHSRKRGRPSPPLPPTHSGGPQVS